MADARRTVWILGAGFSRSLGGPLLPDLLSPPTNNFVGALYDSNLYIGDVGMRGPEVDSQAPDRSAAQLVRTLYKECGGSTAEPGKRFWDDAEAFLDQLDAAAHGGPTSPAAARISNALDRAFGDDYRDLAWSTVRDAARRLVAAACCSFLRDADLTEERWQPYLAWAKATGPSDTVITFNYDRVLELLKTMKVVDPSNEIEGPSTQAQVFKLHGSVDWRRIEGPQATGTRFVVTDEPELALRCPGFQIGIATPGPTKRIAANELKALWTAALGRIKAAEVVVFVGYRFPPGDAEARERIHAALSETTSTHVELHVVLGPDRGHRDVVRLEQLLRYAMGKAGRYDLDKMRLERWQLGPDERTFGLTVHALFAEDLFTVWRREVLWPKGLTILPSTASG